MTSSVTTTEIRDASGRRIAYCEYGDPTGQPVVVAHGSPGSRYEGLSLHNAAAAAGIRLIVPDRPGFGRTDPSLDKGFHSWDDDFVTLIDHLELDSATLMGFSGGGGYALAVAAAVPERVSKLVLGVRHDPRGTARYFATQNKTGICVVLCRHLGSPRGRRNARRNRSVLQATQRLSLDLAGRRSGRHDQRDTSPRSPVGFIRRDRTGRIRRGCRLGSVSPRGAWTLPIDLGTNGFPTRNRRRKRTHRSSPLGTLVDSRLSLRRDQRRRPSVRRRRPHSAHSRPRLIPLDSNGVFEYSWGGDRGIQ